MQVGGAGRARARVDIQRKETGRDGSYNEESDFIPLKSVWVQISPRFGNERNALASTESEVSQVLRGEYLEWQDVTAADRVVFDGTVFNIKSVILDRNNRREVMIDLIEVVEDPSSMIEG